jgi:hypothetical protein
MNSSTPISGKRPASLEERRSIIAPFLTTIPLLERRVLEAYTGASAPDKIIYTHGQPFLFRWYLTSPRPEGNVMFHLQVASDPAEDPHDHPWDNFSVILAGGYHEYIGPGRYRIRTVGDCIYRRAEMPHRLVLPERLPCSMSLFTRGPKVREWGFYKGWRAPGWVGHEAYNIATDGGAIVHE